MDISEAEIYLLTKPKTDFTFEEIRKLVEDDYGYGLRSLDTSEREWDTFAG